MQLYMHSKSHVWAQQGILFELDCHWLKSDLASSVYLLQAILLDTELCSYIGSLCSLNLSSRLLVPESGYIIFMLRINK